MVKPTDASLNAILNSRQFYTADLYTITLVGSSTLRYCSGTQDITFNGNLYTAGGIPDSTSFGGPFWDRRDNKAKVTWRVGTGNDTLVVDCIPGAAQVNNMSFMNAIRCGFFDNADFLLQRAFMAASPQQGLAQTALSVALTSTGGNWEGVTERQVIFPGALSFVNGSSATSFQVRFSYLVDSNTTADASIASAYIGLSDGSTNAYNFDGNQQVVTWNGSTFVNFAGGAQTIQSDWITINENPNNRAIVIALQFAGTFVGSLFVGGANFLNVFSAQPASVTAPSILGSDGPTNYDISEIDVRFGGYGVIPSTNCAVIMFQGAVGVINVDRAIATFSIDDYRILFNQQMPKWLFSPTCQNTLYDGNCTVPSSLNASSGTVSAGSSQSFIISTSTGIIANAAQWFDLGKIQFVTGPNAGLSFAVSSYSVPGGVGNIFFTSPLPFAPTTSDTFLAYPGCDRSTGAGGCGKAWVQSTFTGSNIANFRGMPYIPDPETAI